MVAFTLEPESSLTEDLAQAGLKAQALVSSDTEYSAREDSYWSNTAKIAPACIVRPKSTAEVSSTIQALVAAKRKFAIRSGGHTPYAGAANIEGGVTIDLGLLNWTRFDEESETVDLGPGGRWGPVYEELRKHGRVVAGGRDGHVGVAGLLLGGGKTFFTARRGFACDDVVSYEIVLANGRIVTANTNNHEDLFRALKGGMNNFGIVTNFKMRTFKCGDVWAGLTFYPKEVTQDAVEALADFTENIPNDMDSNLLCFFTYAGMYEGVSSNGFWMLNELRSMFNTPNFASTVVCTVFVQVAGVENAPAYDQWLKLPSTGNTCKMTSVSDLVNEYAIAPLGYYDTFHTACFKNDTRIIAKASELHDTLVEELKAFIPDGSFITQCLFQPLSKLIGQRSVEAGGNVMGVEHQKHNGLLFTAVVMVKTAEQDAIVYPKIKRWLQELQDFATTIEDGNQEWIFMNYADPSQDPLRSYGAENVVKMRNVALKYDPDQVFQNICPGGFKISDVQI